LLFSCQNQAQIKKKRKIKMEIAMKTKNIYQFKVEDLSGNMTLQAWQKK
jgi:hypothetical protein